MGRRKEDDFEVLVQNFDESGLTADNLPESKSPHDRYSIVNFLENYIDDIADLAF
jgi:hypothetical protein